MNLPQYHGGAYTAWEVTKTAILHYIPGRWRRLIRINFGVHYVQLQTSNPWVSKNCDPLGRCPFLEEETVLYSAGFLLKEALS